MLKLNTKGFTLIELLVVITLIITFTGMVVFSTGEYRQTSRDNQRKVDLHAIKSGMEEFYSHCRGYLSAGSYYERFSNPHYGGSLTGYDWIARDRGYKTCTEDNVIMKKIPQDPQHPARIYRYNRYSDEGYVICAALENEPEPAPSTADLALCGGACGPDLSGTTVSCNYVIKSTRN